MRTLPARLARRGGDATDKIYLTIAPADETIHASIGKAGRSMAPSPDTGVLYCDDNLARLRHMPGQSIDLVYLDPPFFSNQVYEVIWGDEAEVRSFEDRWEGGIHHYVDWMRQRITELHRILKPTGTLYLHCDPHASHYLKIMLDDVFGASNFRSEVIWKRSSSHNSANRWAPVHDVIFMYTRGSSYTWNPVFQPLPPETADAWYNNVEEGTGRRYNRADLTAPGVRTGDSGAPWRGIDPGARGRHWAIPGFVQGIVEGLDTLSALDALDAAGRIHWPKKRGGQPMLKRYLAEAKGLPALDVITDIRPLNNATAERLGYPTQKPEELLKRIIEASSSPGDIVLDPFCGCGTTVAVADRLGREWLGIDISPTAMEVMRRRLRKQDPSLAIRMEGLPDTRDALKQLKPFEFQNWVIAQINGTHSPRRVHDMGIDGYSFLAQEPVQVKQSERVGRNVIDNFQTALRRAGADRGYVIAFSFTKGAREEVARAKWEDRLDVVLVKVEQLLQPADRRRGPLFRDQPGDLIDLPLPDIPRKEDRPSPDELVASDRSAS